MVRQEKRCIAATAGGEGAARHPHGRDARRCRAQVRQRLKGLSMSKAHLRCARTSEGARFKFLPQQRFTAATLYRGNGSAIEASAYPITVMAVAFSRSSRGTILSSVSAAVW